MHFNGADKGINNSLQSPTTIYFVQFLSEYFSYSNYGPSKHSPSNFHGIFNELIESRFFAFIVATQYADRIVVYSGQKNSIENVDIPRRVLEKSLCNRI